MSKKIINEEKEVNLVIGEVIENFVKEEPMELSQEEQIEKFKLKKKQIKQILTDEEKKKKEEEEREEEEELKRQKAELLVSIRERIPAIERKIYGQGQVASKKAKLETTSKEIDLEKNNEKDNKKSNEKNKERKPEEKKGFER